MGDAEYTFNITNRDRAIIKNSAKYKKNGSRSRGCTFPSDYLTPAQKRKLNGGIITMNMNKPMDYRSLVTCPEDLQKEYLHGLVTRFNATNRALGEMLGVSAPTVNRLKHKLGIEEAEDFRRRMSHKQTEMFKAWLNASDTEETAPEMDQEISTEPEEIPRDVRHAPVTSTVPEITAGSLTLTGVPMLILDRIHWLFSSCEGEYTIRLTWTKKETEHERDI